MPLSENRASRRLFRTVRVIGVCLVVLIAAWFLFQWVAEPASPPAFYKPPAGLPAAPGSVIRRKNLTVLTALAIASWSHLYPNAHEGAIVHPVARPLVDHLGRRCVATTGEGISDLPDVVALRARFLSADPAKVPGWTRLFRQNSPSTIPADIPLLISRGLRDTLVRPDVTEKFALDQCRAGANIELETYRGAGHFAVRTVAAPRVVSWLQDRLNGRRAASRCTTLAQR